MSGDNVPTGVVLKMLAQLAVHRSCQLGAIVSVAALIQGIYVYAKYGIFHRHQSHPIVPSGGSVTAARRKRSGRKQKSHTTSGNSNTSNVTSSTTTCPPCASRHHHHHHHHHTATTKRRILIVGDSLAVGVGCSGSHPSLPIAIARGLSDQWGGIEVEWDSLGVVGADTPTIFRVVQEHLVQHNNSRADGIPYDVVVVIAGLNDTKHCALPWLWKSKQDVSGSSSSASGPASFERELQNLVRMIQHNTGHHAAVVLPALPVNFSPFLSLQPLATFLHPILKLWDRKKERVAARFPNVHFVSPPSGDQLREILSGDQLQQLMVGTPHSSSSLTLSAEDNRHSQSHNSITSLCDSGSSSSSEEETTQMIVRHVASRDRVHPNDLGYCLWGTHIARSIGSWLDSRPTPLTLLASPSFGSQLGTPSRTLKKAASCDEEEMSAIPRKQQQTNNLTKEQVNVCELGKLDIPHCVINGCSQQM